MNKPTKKGFVPALRFPEFRDHGGWTVKKVEEVCEKPFSGGTPSTTNSQYYGGTIPFIRSGEIEKEKTELFLTNEGLKNSSAKIVKKGDVLVALYGANSGEVALGKINGAINQAVLCLRSKTSNAFLYQNFLYKQQKIISTYLQGGQGNLSGDIIKSIELLFPEPDEQQKFADCFSSIDELITAEDKKLETLNIHKQGLMQQLFPAEGKTVPKLRFPEFRDAGKWEAKELKDACQMQAGKFVRASEIHDQKNNVLYPCYGGNGLRGYTKSYTHDGKYSLIGRQGALCGNVTLVNGKFHATEHAVVTTPKEGVDTDWLFYELTLLNLNKYATGQAQPGLSVENLEKVSIQIPRLKNEQKKIADCLASIDKLITNQTQKLDALKTQKIGLMQRLFPTMDEVEA